MAKKNGSPQNGAANGGGNTSPAVHVPKPGAKQDLKQNITRDKYTPIPHVDTFAGIYGSVNKNYYIYWDEALRNSQANTLAMRRDSFIEELINHRTLPIICTPFHIECDDPEHPDQMSISETVQKIVNDVPRLKVIMRQLLEAIFYGRYGAQIQLGARKVAGNTWTSVTRSIPVNGDKFRFKFDGTPGIAIYPPAAQGTSESDLVGQSGYLVKYKNFIEQTMLGPALFLKPQELRDRFVIHTYVGSDTDYLFEIDEAQAVFGLGLRSRHYWYWNLHTEIFSWIVDALQRIGASGLIYGFYPTGNFQAQQEVIRSLQMLAKDNIGAFPVPMSATGNLKDWLQRIEVSPVAYEIMERLLDRIEGIIRRAFLGQDLSSKSNSTGMGSGMADLHGDVRLDVKEFDCNMLAETLTEQLVSVIVRYNKWKYEGEELRGEDLPFGMRLKFDIDKGDGPARVETAGKLYEMGVPLDQDEVRKAGAFSPPKKKSSALINHALEQTKLQNEAGQPQFNQMNDHLKGILSTGKEAQSMGMTGVPNNGNGKARFERLIERFTPSETVSKFKKEFIEGEEELSSSDKSISVHEVAKILTKQYHNIKGNFTPKFMKDKWLSSTEYKLVKDVPLWCMRPYKWHPKSDKSHSNGPIILDSNKQSYKLKYGAFGSDPEIVICDGKHRFWQALYSGKKTYDCFVGDAIYEDMKEYIKEFTPKRDKFVAALSAYYEAYHEDKEDKSRFAKAGDADDCGHNPSGGFSEGNTCAGEGGREINGDRKKKLEDALSFLDSKTYKIDRDHLDYVSNKYGLSKINKGEKTKEYKNRLINEINDHIGVSSHENNEEGSQQSNNEYINYYDESKGNDKKLEEIFDNPKFTDYTKSLSKEEKESLGTYSSMNFDVINKTLRGTQIEEDYEDIPVKQDIKNISKALTNSSLPENMIVFRGIEDLASIDSSFDYRTPDSIVGSRINDKAFLSTTIDKRVGQSNAESRGALLEMKAKKGLNGISLSGLSNAGSEFEFLFNKGYDIYISGYRKEKDGLVLEAEILNSWEDSPNEKQNEK
jgi:hypothetical protein